MVEGQKPSTTEALRALQLHEARWQAILDSARDAIIGIDRTGRITLFNRAAEAMFGYAAAEVIDRNVTMLMPSPYRDEHDAYLTAYARTRVPKAIGRVRDVEGRRKDGEIFPIALSVSEARVGDDVIYSAIIRDITDRKRAERAQAEAEARHRAVLDTAVWAIIGIDEEGRVLSFNRAAERLFGFPAPEVIGRNVSLLMPSPYHEEHDHYLRRYLETGERRIIGIGREVTGRRKDGTTFPIDLAVNDTILEGRHLFTGVIRDLTSEKAAEARERELLTLHRQHERLADIGAMTARIAHDFGNPLAGLQMTAERVLRRIARDPSATAEVLAPPVELMLATAKRLDALIGEFKEFAREQRLDLADVGTESLLRDVAASWQTEAMARGIALEHVATGLPDLLIRADRTKLQRVLDNLVKNALEAIDKGPGMIRLAVLRMGDQRIRISVEDSGPGLPTGQNVFGLFETTKADGTGLGLPICQEIARAHGGGIDFAPRQPHGTVFHVDLPVHAVRPEPH
jgi:two-component system, LuxR family, sensor kinase FixL